MPLTFFRSTKCFAVLIAPSVLQVMLSSVSTIYTSKLTLISSLEPKVPVPEVQLRLMVTSVPLPVLANKSASDGEIVQPTPPVITKLPSYLTLPGKVIGGKVIGETVLSEAISAVAIIGYVQAGPGGFSPSATVSMIV